jgi:ABC-type multidrug transport system fused ATPase/permease subunit
VGIRANPFALLLRSIRADQRERIRVLITGHRGRIITLSILTFAAGVFEALFLVVVTRTALAIADDQDVTGLVAGWSVGIPWALVISLLLLLARLATSLSGVATSVTLSRLISNDLRRQLVSAFLRASWAVQQAEPVGRLQQLSTAFVRGILDVISALTFTISMLMNLVALLVIAVVVDPVASLVVVVALVALGAVLAPIRVRIGYRSHSAANAQLELSRLVSEFGDLGLEMQTFGVGEQFSDRIKALSTDMANRQGEADLFRGYLPHLYTFLAFGAVVLGLVVAASVGVGELSAIGAVMLVMLRSLTYGQQLQSASGMLFASLPFLDEVENTLERYQSNTATQGHVEIRSIEELRAENVSFAYAQDRFALENVSFSIRRGEIIGIIGPSGAGKSTLVQLLLGLWEPTSGSIFVNGVPLTDVDRSSWTRLVSFVPQDAHLSTGTVAENIRFFRDDIEVADIRGALEKANLSSDVDNLADGLETHLGERGLQLSGGQRQRMSIARALVANPQLLILDEPTSSLDVTSESMIRQTIARLKGEVTVVVIAHRLSTLDMCDRLMVIDGGHLMAFDTPERLRADSVFYRNALLLSGIEQQ